ncbi:MAG: protein translocase subunit SecF, partial [Megasphaera micronuciformis]|nr:protein translocase subunit SecF [Megasphaera micronuciformis]
MKFSIVKHRKWWFTLSTLLVVASIVSIVMNGFNFGIDYTGGTILDLRFGKAVTVSEVRQVLDTSGMNLDNSVIQLTGVTEGDSSQDVMIRMRNLSSDETKALADKFSTQLGNSEVKRTESVGAVIGAEVTKNAVTSLAVAFIALAAYISFRFEYKIAVSALSLTHL